MRLRLDPYRKTQLGLRSLKRTLGWQVQKLAENFNRHLRLERKAPRAKDVVQQLETMRRLTDELAKLLASFDDITRESVANRRQRPGSNS